MVVFDDLMLTSFLEILNQKKSWDIIILFTIVEISFWVFFSAILIQFLPKKYKPYRRDIFIFFAVINIGLLFVGILLTIIMLLFGLSWATHRVSHPSYEEIDFDEQLAQFPIVYSAFQEGILTMEGEHRNELPSDIKIKSLKILYDSNAQGNIGKIKKFLSDSSDETRLYAFALVSSFEKKLNDRITQLQGIIKEEKNKTTLEKYNFDLAQTYWQFIYHGVADEQLSGFYTKKIENILVKINSNSNAFILLGKIHIFNKEYDKAEEAFNKALKLGVPLAVISTFFAEIKYGQKKYNSVAKYIIPEQFNLDLRLKPLVRVWVK
jgi:tetratricopeptide (TPR) repeat protein